MQNFSAFHSCYLSHDHLFRFSPRNNKYELYFQGLYITFADQTIMITTDFSDYNVNSIKTKIDYVGFLDKFPDNEEQLCKTISNIILLQ
jgi:hypothetical protein